MDILKRVKPVHIAAGYCILAVLSFINTARLATLGFIFSFSTILYIAVCVFTAIVLFQKRRDILLVAATGAMALLNLIDFSLLGLLSTLSLAAVAACCILPQLEKYRPYAQKFWFIPAGIQAVSFLWLLLRVLISGSLFYSLPGLLGSLLSLAVYLALALWLVHPEGAPDDLLEQVSSTVSSTAAAVTADAGAAATDKDAYFDLVIHVLLLLFTCGIWMYIWIYKTTRYLNNVPGEEYRNPTTKLLLCLFVPFYAIYWTYKSAQRIDKLAASRGIRSDIANLCLILAIFVGIIPPILMQAKLNEIVGGKESASPAPASSAPVQDVTEQLKKYKELLDAGIITQEEFDAKKKQLLDL